MKIVEAEWRIDDMPDGEAALAKIERMGRIAYKSEDKIRSGHCDACSHLLDLGDKRTSGYVENGRLAQMKHLTLLCHKDVGGSLDSESAEYECPECGQVWQESHDHRPGWRDHYVDVDPTRGPRPSSHRFVKMILQAERKAKMIMMGEKMLWEAAAEVQHDGTLNLRSVEAKEFAERLVTNIIDYMRENPAHESVIEHCSATVVFTSNRGFTHEIVRHRLASFTQSSTRYCDYMKGKFGSEISCTKRELPPSLADKVEVGWLAEWEQAMKDAEYHYRELRRMGLPPELARDVLPNALVADISVTANFREWNHIFALRDSPKAHPDMRKLMGPLHEEFRKRVPIVFD